MSYLFDRYAKIYDYFMRLCHLDDTSIIEMELSDNKYNVLDIGGGSGTLGNRLIKQGHQVTILDPSLSMLKQAMDKNSRLQLIHADLTVNLPIAKVDVIICRDCLHHLSNQTESLKIMKQYLKDDGFILIHDFVPQAKRVKLLFLFERCCFERIKPITIQKLTKIAQESQFAIEVIYQGKWDYICKMQRLI